MSDATRAALNEEMWGAIEEKASLHAVLLRYMRFGNDSDMEESGRILRAQSSEQASSIALAGQGVPYAQAALLRARVRAREHLLQHASAILSVGL